MKTIIQITLVFALIGNLTIPQSLVKYSPCCYDKHGNLTLGCQARKPTQDIQSIALKTKKSCCDPVKIILRGNPAPQLNNVIAPPMPDTDGQAVTAPPIDFGAFPDRDACALGTAMTGPPAAIDILARSCRLNL